MCVLLGVLVWLLASRTDVGVTLLRTSGQLYQEQPNNQMSNLYNYKALNKTFKSKEIVLKPENFNGRIEGGAGCGCASAEAPVSRAVVTLCIR